jgi:hypothetical protein
MAGRNQTVQQENIVDSREKIAGFRKKINQENIVKFQEIKNLLTNEEKEQTDVTPLQAKLEQLEIEFKKFENDCEEKESTEALSLASGFKNLEDKFKKLEDEFRQCFIQFLSAYLQLKPTKDYQSLYDLVISQHPQPAQPILVSFSGPGFFVYFCHETDDKIKNRIIFIKGYLDFINNERRSTEERQQSIDINTFISRMLKIDSQQLREDVYQFVFKKNIFNRNPHSEDGVGKLLSRYEHRIIFDENVTTPRENESFAEYIARMQCYSERINAVCLPNYQMISDFYSCTDKSVTDGFEHDLAVAKYPWLDFDEESFQAMENPLLPHYRKFLRLSIAQALDEHFQGVTVDSLDGCSTEDLENIYSLVEGIKGEGKKLTDISSSDEPCEKFLYLSLEYIIRKNFPGSAVKRLDEYSKRELDDIFSSNKPYEKFLCLSVAPALDEHFRGVTVDSLERCATEDLEKIYFLVERIERKGKELTDISSSDEPHEKFLYLSLERIICKYFPGNVVDRFKEYSEQELDDIFSSNEPYKTFLCLSIWRVINKDFPDITIESLRRYSIEELESTCSSSELYKAFLCLLIKRAIGDYFPELTVESLGKRSEEELKNIYSSSLVTIEEEKLADSGGPREKFRYLSIEHTVHEHFPDIAVKQLKVYSAKELNDIFSSENPYEEFLCVSIKKITDDYFLGLTIASLKRCLQEDLEYICSSISRVERKEESVDISSGDELYEKFRRLSIEHTLRKYFPNIAVKLLKEYSKKELDNIFSSNNPYKKFLCLSICQAISESSPAITVDLLEQYSVAELESILSSTEPYKQFLYLSIAPVVTVDKEEMADLFEKYSIEDLEFIYSLDDEHKFFCVFIETALSELDSEVTIQLLKQYSKKELEYIQDSASNDLHKNFLRVSIKRTVSQHFPGVDILKLLENCSLNELKSINSSSPLVAVALCAKKIILDKPWSLSRFGGRIYTDSQGAKKHLCEGAFQAIDRIDWFILVQEKYKPESKDPIGTTLARLFKNIRDIFEPRRQSVGFFSLRKESTAKNYQELCEAFDSVVKGLNPR